jgi:hypothetical protein
MQRRGRVRQRSQCSQRTSSAPARRAGRPRDRVLRRPTAVRGTARPRARPNGQHRAGLGSQELTPAGVGAPQGAGGIQRRCRTLSCHPLHQRIDGGVDGWASGSVRVGPPVAHEAAMPVQDGARGDQAMGTQLRGQAPGEGGEDRSIGPSPGAVSDWCDEAPWPHAAAAAVRCPLRRSCGPSARPGSAPD